VVRSTCGRTGEIAGNPPLLPGYGPETKEMKGMDSQEGYIILILVSAKYIIVTVAGNRENAEQGARRGVLCTDSNTADFSTRYAYVHPALISGSILSAFCGPLEDRAPGCSFRMW
jgi:hypothetical protein